MKRSKTVDLVVIAHLFTIATQWRHKCSISSIFSKFRFSQVTSGISYFTQSRKVFMIKAMYYNSTSSRWTRCIRSSSCVTPSRSRVSSPLNHFTVRDKQKKRKLAFIQASLIAVFYLFWPFLSFFSGRRIVAGYINFSETRKINWKEY